MHRIEIGKLVYRYLAGPYTIGILTPTRKKHIVSLEDVRAAYLSNPDLAMKLQTTLLPGSSDSRVTPAEIIVYVLKNRLK